MLRFERREGDKALQAVFNLSETPATLQLTESLAPLDGSPFAGAELDGRILTLPPFGIFMGEPPHAA